MLEKMIPRVYWSIENIELSEDMENKLIKNFPQDYKKSRSAYNEASEKIKKLLNRNLLSLFLNHIKYKLLYLIIFYSNRIRKTSDNFS